MKTNVLFFLALNLCVWLPIIGNSQNFPSENHNSKNRNLIKLENNPQILSATEKIFPDGSIIFKQDRNISERELIQKLQIDELVTFSLQRETHSRFDQDATFRRYQQYYKGVKIDGGGYTTKSIETFGTNSKLQLFSPNIFYNINLITIPSISEEQLTQILEVDTIIHKELIISNVYSEEYMLLWKVLQPNSQQIWLNAHSGEIVHKYSSEMQLTADLPTYGDEQPLNDFTEGGTTLLRTNNFPLITVYEFNPGPLDPLEWTDDLIPSTNNESDWGTDATPNSLQAFYVANLVVPEFINIGINFVRVRIATISDAAGAKLGSTLANAYLEIGTHNGTTPLSLHDIIGHELAHVYLFSFLQYTNNNTNATLHEGLSDIFGTYVEGAIQGVDWVTGDDEPNVPHRDLEQYICETDVQNAVPHTRGLVIGHWFYSLVAGIPEDEIPAIGMLTVIDILLESLNSLSNSNAGLPEMRMETLKEAEINFGICSPQYTGMLRAWDRVCVPGSEVICGPCDLINFQPSISTQSVGITCSNPINLDLYYTGIIPFGAELIWSTDGVVYDGVNPHLDPLVHTTGTFYAYYFNPEENCYSPASQAFEVTHPFSQDLHILQNTIYDADMEIFGDIYIENGAILTITSTITFGPESNIYIESDSKLLLDGGKLTACNGLKWQGVQVAGHLVIGFSTQLPGQIELKNSAVIEKAIIGIDGTDLYSTVLYPLTFEFGGGIITVQNSYIKNCDIGIKLAPFGWGSIIGSGTPDEQSSISASTIQDCETGIYSIGNLGLEILNGCIFDDNAIDYEGFGSSILSIDNTFSGVVDLYAEFPSVPGSTFEDNTFNNTILGAQSLSNFSIFKIEENTFNGSSIYAQGESWFEITGNDYYNTSHGNVTESTGDNIRNLVVDNAFYNNRYANSAWGENDVEYLTNCFESTEFADIEVNDYSSIREIQGDLQLSAGNCFVYNAKIKTGNNSEHFAYWFKDGFNYLLHCKNPGNPGNFTKMLSLNEASHEFCGRGVDISGNLPGSYGTCECYQGEEGCKEAIDDIRAEIVSIENNSTISSELKSLLTANYKRCLDYLIRTDVQITLDDGDVAGTIGFLTGQPEFRYKIMAYGIMNRNQDYDNSTIYLNSLQTSNQDQEDFIAAQNIYLDYIKDINGFELSESDKTILQDAGYRENELAGYARSIYYLLTGEQIKIDLYHTDGAIAPRSTFYNIPPLSALEKPNIAVFPNPVLDESMIISIDDYNIDKRYTLSIHDLYGNKLVEFNLSSGFEEIYLPNYPGIYMARVMEDGHPIYNHKIIKL